MKRRIIIMAWLILVAAVGAAATVWAWQLGGGGESLPGCRATHHLELVPEDVSVIHE